MTKHYKQMLLPLHDTRWGQVLTSKGNHYLKNEDNEVALLPHWLWLCVEGKYQLTLRWGPYAFHNNMEQTREAKYLMDMFKYRTLTPAAEMKVRAILEQYKLLITFNPSFVEALVEREGCPNYWEVDDGNKN